MAEENQNQEQMNQRDKPSNPAEQNTTLNMPELTPQQDIVDYFAAGMKPPRSDSSSPTFVADAGEAMRHEQAQRIQEGIVMSTDAPGSQVRAKDGTSTIEGIEGVDKNLRSPLNPGGLTDLSRLGIAQAGQSPVRLLGSQEDAGDRPQEIYIGGRPVTVQREQIDKHEQLLKEMQDAQKNRPLDNIPLSDEYWTKKQAYDSFTNSL